MYAHAGGGGGGGGADAACVSVNVCPAIVSVVERAAPGFAATVKVTEPFPVPCAALVIVTHDAPELAVQAQPFPAVTLTVPPPPAARKF